MLKAKQIFTFLLLAFIAACGQAKGDVSQENIIQENTKSNPTKDDWDAALKASYEEKHKNKNDDGIFDFVADFSKSINSGEKLVLPGKYDGFNRITTIFPHNYFIDRHTEDILIGPSVAMIDYGQPLFVLNVSYREKRGLSLRKISILADDKLSFDEKVSAGDLKVNTWRGGVSEDYILILSPNQINSLSSVSKSNNLIVRLSGENGYITLNKKKTARFLSDLRQVLMSYNVLSKKLPIVN